MFYKRSFIPPLRTQSNLQLPRNISLGRHWVFPSIRPRDLARNKGNGRLISPPSFLTILRLPLLLGSGSTDRQIWLNRASPIFIFFFFPSGRPPTTIAAGRCHSLHHRGVAVGRRLCPLRRERWALPYFKGEEDSVFLSSISCSLFFTLSL